MPAELLVKKNVLVPREDFERFRERHPGHGSFTWFVRTCLKKYNDLYDVTADELIEAAVGEVTIKT